MTVKRLFLFVILFSIAWSAQAQLYKWVGADGKINYSDTPPPKSAKTAEAKASSSSDNTVALPYQLSQAVKNMPVVLYGTERCTPCDEARTFLKTNGIPFSEKSIATIEDQDQLKKITGSSQLPAVSIGKTELTGFNSSQWRTNLTQAGYPTSSLLPAGYQFSQAQPLVPATASSVQNSSPTKSAPSQTELPARDPNGFRF